MKERILRTTGALLLILPAGLLTYHAAGAEPPGETPETAVTRPAYDDEGRLLLPEDYREWVWVGSSLGLSYSEGTTAGHEMFHATLMEPAAYRHFIQTGEFADGAMFVLILQGAADGVLPGRRGRFADEVHGVEMAVKDFGRFEEGWAYYGFGGMGGIRKSAKAFPRNACYSCHVEHAALDNVFVQFYPLLVEAAGIEVELRQPEERSATNETASTQKRPLRP